MRQFFQGIWNFVRTLSFIILIGLGLMMVAAITSKSEILRDLQDCMEKKEIMAMAKEEDNFGTQTMPQEEPDFQIATAAKSTPLMILKEYQARSPKKIKIKTQQGEVFLRTSQIVCVKKKSQILQVFTSANKEYSIHERTHSLTQLFDLINGTNSFFRINSSIINCHYVEMIESVYQSKRAVLENQMKIDLPDGQVDLLIDHLENSCF